MNAILSKTQPRQERNHVKNIFLRYCGSKEVKTSYLYHKNYQHPENAYLVKYFPKYYHSLTLVMKPQQFLLSKIKRLKKLKKCRGIFNSKIPQVKWFKILANNRKEIEEFPHMFLPQAQPTFWAKTNLHVAKFFFNITTLQLPTFSLKKLASQDFLSAWEAFSRHLRNMRRLKDLDIETYGININILKKLIGMPNLLAKLQVLKAQINSDVFEEIFSQNKNAFAHLTNLNYILVSSVDDSFGETIPQICKKLKSFSLESGNYFSCRNSMNVMISINKFTKLQSISINWSGFWSIDFWSNFIPPTSLRRLNLQFQFQIQDMINVFFDHWEEIKQLDALDLRLFCENDVEMFNIKNFITKMLKRVLKLTSFQCQIDMRKDGKWKFEPFFVEKVPHLHEHLKKFQTGFSLQKGSVSFDFGLLKPFKNLKEITFQGSSCFWVNIRDAILLLEANMRHAEFSTLKLGNMTIVSQEELMDLLMKISSVKKDETNLKIVLALSFEIQAGDDEIKYLDQFCEAIELNPIKGLEISLDMRYQDGHECNLEKAKEVFAKYPRLRNFALLIDYDDYILEYVKRDGEKDQLLYYLYRS